MEEPDVVKMKQLIDDVIGDISTHLEPDGIDAKTCISKILRRLDGPQYRIALGEEKSAFEEAMSNPRTRSAIISELNKFAK